MLWKALFLCKMQWAKTAGSIFIVAAVMFYNTCDNLFTLNAIFNKSLPTILKTI